jgi:anthranilate phosphoribosyltransferase
MIQDVLKAVVEFRHLSREEAARAMSAIMSGEVSPTLISAFLVALHMKGETVEEITGFAETMRQFATRVETSRHPLVDTCGTGGDRSGTFNISTTAAFVVAGAGVAVAKHGNRSASSKCGSADVLEHLGVNIDASPEQVGRCIDEVGIGFLFARSLHGAMKHVAPVRSELLMRTVFNILGPLTNPAGADGQVMGVFDANLVEPLANVLGQLGARHAFVVSGSDGLDELTLCGHSIVAEVRQGEVRMYTLTPEELGLSACAPEALLGGDASRNADLLRAVLEGERSPRRDIVLLNAAPAIVAGQAAADLAEGLDIARKSIDSGAAYEKLQLLKRRSHDS